MWDGYHKRAASTINRQGRLLRPSGLRIQRESCPCLPLASVHLLVSIPRAAFEESSLRTLTCAELAPDTEIGIDFNDAVWIVVRVGDPEHAFVDRAILDAGGRAGATSAVVHDD